jgi:glucose/arabinose dehydrogenase
MIQRSLVLCVCVLLLGSPAAAVMFDPNVTETSWIAVPSGTTGMAWAPDGSGRLFVTVKTGTVRIVKMGPPPTVVATPFATISPIYTNSECGLIGIAFDPDFRENGYVYFFVTVSSSEQQILRYTAVGDVGTNKTVIMPGLPTAGVNHDGGGIGFGADGRLYWSIGDNGSGLGVDANLTSLASKVSRANVEGTAPKDNPFNDGPLGVNNDYIWARGFRNPFTLTFQPTTGKLWVDVAGTLYEQIFAVGSGEHAGWNDYENNQPAGFLPPSIKYRTNGTDTRTIVAGGASRSAGVATYTTSVAHGFRQGEKLAITGVSDPSFNGNFFVASRVSDTVFTVVQAGANAISGGGSATTQSQGGAVTGGAFYDGTAFPAPYRGNFFFGDYNSGRVQRAVVGPGTTVTSVDYWADNTQNIDVAPGPDGAIYYVLSGGAIMRATYNATEQGLVVSQTHPWITEGHTAVLSIKLALAPAFDVTVSVAPTGGSPDVSVVSGASLTFTPANWAESQTVVLAAAEDLDITTDFATLTVSALGLPSESVEVRVVDNSGSFGGGAPGRVLALQVDKSVLSPGQLDLAWDPSCSAAATDYAVYEGTVGDWYSHNPVLCTTGGTQAATIPPGAGDRYYLVVPESAEREGSLGTDWAGIERPRPGGRCRTERDPSACP